MFVDCDLKYQKITDLLNYLNKKSFIVNLTTFYCEDRQSENFSEQQDVMSLSIDMINNKMRFKFWNGASTFWLFHTKDVFDALDTGRSEFSELYDKYEPVTEVLFDFKNRWRTSIYHISYEYYPDDEFELVYHIIFTDDVRNTNYAGILLKKIYKEITMLGSDVTNDLKFKVEHSFRTLGCLPCQQAREEREKNEREDK